jgi:hypothetical protein
MTVLLLVNSSKTLRTSGSSIHYLVFKDRFCFYLASLGK